MSRRFLVLMAAMLSCLEPMQAALAQESLGVRPLVVSNPNPRGAKGGRLLFIPGPISAQFMGRLAETLGLSDAQRAAVSELYKAYVVAGENLRNRDGDQLWQESEILVNRVPTTAPETGQANVDLMRRSAAYCRKLAKVDSAFFDNILPILADEQVAKLERVRLHREIERVDCVPFSWRAATVDLSLLLFELGKKRAIEIVDVEEANALILEYERAYARLRTDYSKAMEKGAIEGPALLEAWQSSGEAGSKDRAALERYLSLIRKAETKAKRVEDLNRLYASQIGDTLSPVSAAEFRRQYRQSAYPEVFPDPFDVRPLLEEVVAKGNLASDAQGALQDHLDAYSVEEESISNKMVLRVSDRLANFIRLGGDSPHLYEAYKADLDDFQRERRDLAEQAMNQLLQLAPATDQSTLYVRMAAYRKRFAEHKSVERGSSYRP